MDTNLKIIFLTIISCISADPISTDLLPPANVANVFHETGITFVSPSVTNLAISTDLLAPPPPVTHSFGFVQVSPNHPRELVRTHSSQQLSQSIHSSVSALHSSQGIQSNVNGQFKIHNPIHFVHDPSTRFLHIQEPPSDVVNARFVEHKNHGMHEISSRTQHFDYKVPLIRTAPMQYEHFIQIQNLHHHDDIQESKHPKFAQRNSVAKHSTYGVPTFIPAQDEINSLPVFQNDKFLSPIVRHTNTPTHSSNHPVAQTIQSIFDPQFNSNNNPITHTRANVFDPSIHSNNHPTTHTREQVIDGNNQYKNRFSLSDGTRVSEQGKLISTPECENVIAKSGEYEYISPDGTPVKVKWIADHGGFRVIK